MKKLIFAAIMGTMAMGAQAQNAFNLGGDISVLPQYEKANTPYYTSAGTKIPDVLTYMKNTCKWNSMRVRLFVTPDSKTDPQVVQDLEYVKNLGKRIKEAGMDFLLDFHYSDTWADPDNQAIPSTWKSNTSNAVLQDSLYGYTKRCLEYLVENNATPDFVQIGNEVSYGMLWRTNNDRCYSNSTTSTWKRFTDFLSSAAKAVREVTPEAKIVLHVERSGDANATVNFYNTMKNNGVDYDIIGLSYYPFWHGYLSTLSTTLTRLASSFPDKPVQIVETAYYYQWFPTKDVTNTTGTWADTPAGQQAFIEDLCTELAKHNNVTGLYYWFPEENGNGNTFTVLKNWINRGLWDNETHKINAGILKLQNFLTEKEAVGIYDIKVAGQGTSPIYNLSGQQVSSMSAPGIYIKDGKKILKK
ncbi:MAG: glycosyl hydrolase 53 family protein [Bacteroidaceae bacterium]|nr:glycosyl hydrolase 53 family protein [Bacteroidaceae bacterium]